MPSKKPTDKDLKACYLRFNKKFFGGRLPKDLRVRFKKMRKEDLGYTRYFGRTPVVICINPGPYQLVMGTLLHEMCHVNLPTRVQHGKEFQNEMLRIAKLGAFKDIW